MKIWFIYFLFSYCTDTIFTKTYKKLVMIFKTNPQTTFYLENEKEIDDTNSNINLFVKDGNKEIEKIEFTDKVKENIFKSGLAGLVRCKRVVTYNNENKRGYSIEVCELNDYFNENPKEN